MSVSTQNNMTQKEKDRHSCFMRDSNRRSQCPSYQGLHLRPLGHWDQRYCQLMFENNILVKWVWHVFVECYEWGSSLCRSCTPASYLCSSSRSVHHRAGCALLLLLCYQIVVCLLWTLMGRFLKVLYTLLRSQQGQGAAQFVKFHWQGTYFPKQYTPAPPFLSPE
jgi:hypothetical protein